MANFDPIFWTAIVTLLQTVKNVPVERTSQANRFNWMDQYDAGNLPSVIWVVYVGDSIEEATAADAQSYRYPLDILYLRPANLSAAETTANTTVEAAIESKLAAVRDAFRLYSGTAFQLLGRNPTRSISQDSPANQILFDLQDRFYGGGIHVEPLVGDYE